MGLSIGDLAARAGVAPSAIRYYERAGLLSEPGRRSGRRTYDADALREVGFVTRARSAGFSVQEIRQLADLVRGEGGADAYCDDAKSFAREKIIQLDRQIAEAQALREQLADALEEDCSGLDHCAVLSG